MRIAIPILIFAICANSVATGQAAYLIRLKNGNEYITNRYWQDGKQVLFETYDGVFGIDKSFVTKIEPSSRSLPLPVRRVAEPGLAPTANPATSGIQNSSTTPQTQQAEAKGNTSQGSNPVTNSKELVEKDEELLRRFSEVQKRASALNDLERHELPALEDDLRSLRQKILDSSHAPAHQQEISALDSLIRAVANFVRVNSQ